MDQTRTKRWQVAVCERGTVHIHYGTGSLHVAQEDFFSLASELWQTASEIEALASAPPDKRKSGIVQ